jgi:hypothetical protein
MTNSAFNRWSIALLLLIIIYGAGMLICEGWDLGVSSIRKDAIKAGVAEYIMTDQANPKSITFVWKTNQSNIR